MRKRTVALLVCYVLLMDSTWLVLWAQHALPFHLSFSKYGIVLAGRWSAIPGGYCRPEVSFTRYGGFYAGPGCVTYNLVMRSFPKGIKMPVNKNRRPIWIERSQRPIIR
jgi:hypothetical protein